MAYATAAQFVEAFTEREAIVLTNLANPSATTIASTVMARALDDATAEIDSYLWRYTLPFASTPQELIPVCLDIARYRLALSNDFEEVRKRYEDRIRWLELIAKGTVKLALGADDEPVPASTGLGMPAFEGGVRSYTTESLRFF